MIDALPFLGLLAVAAIGAVWDATRARRYTHHDSMHALSRVTSGRAVPTAPGDTRGSGRSAAGGRRGPATASTPPFDNEGEHQ